MTPVRSNVDEISRHWTVYLSFVEVVLEDDRMSMHRDEIHDQMFAVVDESCSMSVRYWLVRFEQDVVLHLVELISPEKRNNKN